MLRSACRIGQFFPDFDRQVVVLPLLNEALSFIKVAIADLTIIPLESPQMVIPVSVCTQGKTFQLTKLTGNRTVLERTLPLVAHTFHGPLLI